MRLLSPAFVLALIVSGCATPATIAPEAGPLVDGAYEGGDGLVAYLEASGVRVLGTEPIENAGVLHRVQAARGDVFRFAGGERCAVYTYDLASKARQLSPQQWDADVIPDVGFGMAPAGLHRAQQPVRFGQSVAYCVGNDSRRQNAFLALHRAHERGS